MVDRIIAYVSQRNVLDTMTAPTAPVSQPIAKDVFLVISEFPTNLALVAMWDWCEYYGALNSSYRVS